MIVVVTGSEGLVGERLVARLLADGHVVRSLDLRSVDAPRDIRDPGAWAAVVSDADGIVHLAAVSRVAWGESHPYVTQSINVDGTATAVAAASIMPRAPWFLFASSREVYGDPVAALVRENDPLVPVNAYGRSKCAGEEIVAAAKARGIATAIIRLSNVYGGRRDHPDRAVPSLIGKAIAGVPLPLTGGDHFFDFVHVDDVVDGLVAAIKELANGKIALPTVHFASGRSTSLRSLAALAVAATRSSSPVIEVEARAFDVKGFCGDPALARTVYGWSTRIAIEEGVTQVADDIARHGMPPPVPVPA